MHIILLNSYTLYLNDTKSLQSARYHGENICLFHWIHCHNRIQNLQGEVMACLLTIIDQYTQMNKNTCWFLLCVVPTISQSNRKHSLYQYFFCIQTVACWNHQPKWPLGKQLKTNSRMGPIWVLSWSPSWKCWTVYFFILGVRLLWPVCLIIQLLGAGIVEICREVRSVTGIQFWVNEYFQTMVLPITFQVRCPSGKITRKCLWPLNM